MSRHATAKRYFATLTDGQLVRLYRRVYDRMASSGGTSYGIDWHTMRITHPDLCEYEWAILQEMRQRHEADVFAL